MDVTLKPKNIQLIIRQLRYTPTGILVTSSDISYIKKLIDGLKLGFNQVKNIKSLEHRINDVNDSLEHLPFYVADISKHPSGKQMSDDYKKYFDTHMLCFVVLSNYDIIGVRINKSTYEINYDSLVDKIDSDKRKFMYDAMKLYITLQTPMYINTPMAVVNIEKISKEIFHDIYMQLFNENYKHFANIVELYTPNSVPVIEVAKEDGEITVLIQLINRTWDAIVESGDELNLEQNGVKELIEVYLHAHDNKMLNMDGLWNK